MTSLSKDFVHETIDAVLASVLSSSLCQHRDITLRRVVTSEDWVSLSSQSRTAIDDSTIISDGDCNNNGDDTDTVSRRNNIALSADTSPFYFGIQVLHNNIIVGFCTFHIAYSTWDGRMVYVDQLQHFEDEDNDSLLIYHVLAKIAIQIGALRLTWKVRTEYYTKYVSIMNI